MPIEFQTIDKSLIKPFNGILVLGDVHGMFGKFTDALSYAVSNNLYIISLGDLVDYGDHSSYVVDMAYNFVERGQMSIVYGNHERKLYKFFKQRAEGKIRVTVGDALKASIKSFDDRSESVFMMLVDGMANVIRYEHCWFTHGAIHPSLYTRQEMHGIAYNHAMFGEVDNTTPMKPDGYPNRVYNWVKHIPTDHMVYVGHDIRSYIRPFQDGNAIFMDTGCGKGGVLSGMLLDHTGDKKAFITF
jgi:hypothetical protein